jgi:hypothetical protein
MQTGIRADRQTIRRASQARPRPFAALRHQQRRIPQGTGGFAASALNLKRNLFDAAATICA